ncbi:MAG TPA: hypothetical protein VGI45_09005 [Terracidiphilus sp.]
MDVPNLGANLSMVREHLQLFAILLFALPSASFLSIKLWIAARASKTTRSTTWFVPDDLESDAARMHYSMGRSAVAFAHVRHGSRSIAEQNQKMRRGS